MGILVCIYTSLLQSCYGLGIELPPILFFVCLLDASWSYRAVKRYYCLFYTLEQWLLHLPPQWIGWVVWGLYPSFRLSLLCGYNLCRAWVIFDDWRCGDVDVACWGGLNCCACAITGRCWGVEVQEWSIACGSCWSWCCTWYWVWCRLEFVLSEETAVPKWNPSWSINPHLVLTICDDFSCCVPSVIEWALDSSGVTSL